MTCIIGKKFEPSNTLFAYDVYKKKNFFFVQEIAIFSKILCIHAELFNNSLKSMKTLSLFKNSVKSKKNLTEQKSYLSAEIALTSVFLMHFSPHPH
jgi:hypothetical protein